MAKVKFTQSALEYIKDKTDTVTLLVEIGRSWAGTFKVPAVYAGKPDAEDQYDFTEVDGLNVYVEKSSPIDTEGLEVDLKGVGMFKKLVIDGFLV